MGLPMVTDDIMSEKLGFFMVLFSRELQFSN